MIDLTAELITPKLRREIGAAIYTYCALHQQVTDHHYIPDPTSGDVLNIGTVSHGNPVSAADLAKQQGVAQATVLDDLLCLHKTGWLYRSGSASAGYSYEVVEAKIPSAIFHSMNPQEYEELFPERFAPAVPVRRLSSVDVQALNIQLGVGLKVVRVVEPNGRMSTFNRVDTHEVPAEYLRGNDEVNHGK